jgi:hypothetical protein
MAESKPLSWQCEDAAQHLRSLSQVPGYLQVLKQPEGVRQVLLGPTER